MYMTKYSDVKVIIRTKWPKVKIKSITEFSEGYNNLAYDIILSNGSYVIKLLKIKGFEKYVLKQNHIHDLVQRKFKNFPIAKIIESDFSNKIINWPYIIAEKIEGNSLQKLYASIKNKEELYEEIGEIYGKLHSFKFKSYGELDSSLNLVKKYDSWYLSKVQEVEKFFNEIEKKKLLSKKTLQINKRFFKNNKLLLKKEIGPCLCHGDAADTNILISKFDDKYKLSGLIDFEFARSGGAVHDLFSGLRSFEKKYKYRDSLIEGYTKWSKLPKEWEKLIFLYLWMGHLNQLTRIEGMNWRNLNNLDSMKRKGSLRKNSLSVLRKVLKMLK